MSRDSNIPTLVIHEDGHQSVELRQTNTAIPYTPNSDIQIGGGYTTRFVIGSNGKVSTHTEDRSGLLRRNYGRSGGFLGNRFNR